MKSSIYIIPIYFLLLHNSTAQAPNILWQKCLGGTNLDRGTKLAHQPNGNIGAVVFSGSNNGDITIPKGSQDFWVYQLDANGNLLWQKSLGGTDSELPTTICAASDGGYVVGGASQSNDGDFNINHGGFDGWLVKLDANGNLQWKKNFGGSLSDLILHVTATKDGGYIAIGDSGSNDLDFPANNGGSDIWVIKLDAQGNVIWKKNYGGTGNENAFQIIENSKGGYTFCGNSDSSNGDLTKNNLGPDYWIVSLDADGKIVWQRSLGGSGFDSAHSLVESNDGSIFIAGQSESNDKDVTGIHGGFDAWVIKLNGFGILQWEKCFGGTATDYVDFINVLSDNTLILSGTTSSNDGDVSGQHGQTDAWVFSINVDNKLLWQKCYGGSGADISTFIFQAQNNDIIFTGSTRSNDEDVFGNKGFEDAWTVRLSKTTAIVNPKRQNEFTIRSNPFIPGQVFIEGINETNIKLPIMISDLQGKEIYNSEITLVNSNRIELNTSEYNSGIYLIRIKYQNTWHQGKISIIR